MKKYYEIDPDEGSYFVSISNLTEEQKEYIARNIFVKYDLTDIKDDDDTYDNGRTYKYYIDAPCCYENNIFNKLIEYLKKEGYININGL